MLIDIKPVPKPRMTRADKWKKRPAVMRYRAFCDELRSKFSPEAPETPIVLIFNLPMPKSWSKKKKIAMDGKPHLQRPDLDNLEKAWNDALHKEDSAVWNCWSRKFWSYTGSIEINYRKGGLDEY